MKHVRHLVLALATAAVAASGCGSDDTTCGDAGCPDADVGDAAASTGDAGMLWGLSRGTNSFKITAVSGATDGCMIGVTDLATLNAKPFPVTYDETTMTVSIGMLTGTPAMAS